MKNQYIQPRLASSSLCSRGESFGKPVPSKGEELEDRSSFLKVLDQLTGHSQKLTL